MLDKETIKNISTFVEITMQVEERLRGKYDFEVERLTKELDEVKEERDAMTGECYDYEKRTCDLEAQIEELTGQKERQAAKITELTDERDRQKKQIAELGKELKVRVEMPPATDDELQKKLDKAMDHIRRQGEEIDKLRAGAADPRWVPLRNRRPDMNENVLACTKRGTIYIAQETDEGWKNTTGKMSEPVAWMPLPARSTGGEA